MLLVKRRSLALLPLLAAARPARAESFPLEALMAQLAAIPERRARFREERRFKALTQTLSSRGRLLYRRPDYLEMDKEWPNPERTVIDGTRLIVTLPGNEPPRVVDFGGRPELSATFEAMRAPLAGDLAALRRSFTIQAEGTLEKWTLVLAPLDPRAAKVMRTARLAGQRAWISDIRFAEANGDEASMQIEPA